MARIQGVADEDAGILIRFAYWFARRVVGKVPEPMRITARHPGIFRAYGAFEYGLDRAHLVPTTLKVLASLRAADRQCGIPAGAPSPVSPGAGSFSAER